MKIYHHNGFAYIITPRKDGNGRMVTIRHGEASTPVFMDVDSDEKALEALGVPKGYVTLVAHNGKPMKVVGVNELPKGKKKYLHNHNPIKVTPVPVIVMEERDGI